MPSRRSFLALAAAAALWLPGEALAQSGEIMAVVGHDAPPYRDALNGLRQAFRDKGLSLRAVQLDAAGKLPRDIVPAAPREESPIIALGARAVDALDSQAQVRRRTLPCMVLDAGPRPGVELTPDPGARIALLRELLPAARVVGVLYSDDNPPAAIGALSKAAAQAGLRLAGFHIDADLPLDRQLDALANEFGALLATFDLRIYSQPNAQALLQFSYRHRIPLIGLSDAWTHAGALASTDWDYEDLGRQCGEMAWQIQQKAAPLEQRGVPPRKLPYSINRSSAYFFRLEIPERLARGARLMVD